MSLSDSDDMQTDVFREPVEPRPCRRHRWAITVGFDHQEPYAVCVFCKKRKDEARSRRGKNARSRGNALERWVNGLLGIANRGKFGGPDDGGGANDWISVQTKSGSYFPRLIDRWLRAVPQRAGQMRGAVLVETPGPDTPVVRVLAPSQARRATSVCRGQGEARAAARRPQPVPWAVPDALAVAA